MQTRYEFALEFGEILENTVLPEGWLVFSSDLGEVEVTAPTGQRFRLVADEVPEDE